METNTKHQKLLEEFSAPDFKKWLELVDSQLKGVPFEKKLVTKTIEGLPIQPIYLKKDARQLSAPGQFPYTRSSKASGSLVNKWEVSQRINCPTAKQFNEAIKNDIENGITCINLVLDQAGRSGYDPEVGVQEKVGKGGLSISVNEDIETALYNIDFSDQPFQIDAGVSTVPFLGLLFANLKKQNVLAKNLKGNVIFDPLSILAVNSDLRLPLENLYDQIVNLTKWAKNKAPDLKTLGIDSRPYLEGGGSAVQELAFSVATAVEYLRELQNRGLTINEVASNISFTVATGSDFFMEIAKLRALRSIWANVVKAFDGNIASQKATIYSCSARYNKTIHDPTVNMLRNTTEAFSSILGGCDVLSVEPFNDIQGQADAFSRRIARNTQLVLKEECAGDKVVDPVGGSWFVENLTSELAETAWNLFQEIEKLGGMTAALKAGFPQKTIKETHVKRSRELAQLKIVSVGTNKYANLEEAPESYRVKEVEQFANLRIEQLRVIKEKKSGTIELEQLSNITEDVFKDASKFMDKIMLAASKHASLGDMVKALQRESGEKFSVNPITIQRGTKEYEILRENALAFKKQNGDLPKVFLANMGPLRQHKARADFTTGFLEPGGFQIMSNDGFDNVADAIEATISSGANIVVMCSTDDTYPELVPEFTKSLKTQQPGMTIVIAGYPKDHIEHFKDIGVDTFIHLKANNLELLKIFHQKAGV
mgnify:CR=1 FL=1